LATLAAEPMGLPSLPWAFRLLFGADAAIGQASRVASQRRPFAMHMQQGIFMRFANGMQA